jgi:hypothetical protein
MVKKMNVNLINQIKTIRPLINWRLLKQKMKDNLTMFPTQELMLETYVITKEGRIREYHKQKAHSYVIQWLQHIELLTNHSYGLPGRNVSIKDTAGTVRTFYNGSCTSGTESYQFSCEATAGITTYGILCGTGVTAVNISDYTIQTLIANGSGSGQLNYSATVVVGAIAGSTTCSMAVTRAVSNGYSSGITIKEIGLVCATSYSGTTQDNFLLIHDNVTQLLNSGDTYLIIYTMVTSISS